MMEGLGLMFLVCGPRLQCSDEALYATLGFFAIVFIVWLCLRKAGVDI